VGHGGQEAGLHLGGIIHAGRHAMGEQVEQEGLLTGRGGLDQFDQGGGLFGRQRQGRNAISGAFCNVLTIGLQHEVHPIRKEWKKYGLIVALWARFEYVLQRISCRWPVRAPSLPSIPARCGSSPPW